jgi:hypothetical protein
VVGSLESCHCEQQDLSLPRSDNSEILHQLALELLQKHFIILLQRHIIVQLLRISPSKDELHMFNGEGEVIASSTAKSVY